jgi:hypothetical protein
VKIVGYTALHYGKDFLGYAIQSVAPDVDVWAVAYSPVGSHGHPANAACPESEAELRAIAEDACAQAGVPLHWYSGHWQHEGQQRDSVFSAEPDADLVIVVDADEVWEPGAAASAIQQGLQMNARSGHAPFIHFWRSFGWVCRDAAQPVRVIRPRIVGGDAYLDVPPVLHFGYARKPADIAYKMQTHGHKGEWRPEWYAQTFLAWQPGEGDLHPTNHDFWTAEPFDRETLPDALKAHPYYGPEVIE